ncbi:hypothetical protein BAUCODRAFT_61170 [Baudoinia panamericana UAMH 10762]|uniref:WW domain-containing protein n=1 Tax=Baudoinia panamericana (strain UAMH 10762) TaxID=717646 RepID=M2N9V7_BAUPA|nr:uncharacterized protein BAUCODRAFT_61170 [Baudoinia panamericana UAMH 10762]EMD00984.1 hypothetical protein BAUCODRAFT_61170 [Baudoinia panamericana UAMH 10762]
MALWAEAKAADGRTYYYRKDGSGFTTWEKPEDYDGEAVSATPAVNADQAAIDAAWNTAHDNQNKVYYWNGITKLTTYDEPEAYRRQQQQVAQPAAPAFVAGGTPSYGGRDDHGPPRERRMDRRDDRDHLPQRAGFDKYRGPMPLKDEPAYTSPEQQEEAFVKLLKKYDVSHGMSYEEAMRKVIKERDFRAIPDPYDRQKAFNKYCDQVRAEEKGKEKERKEKLREDFRKMLSTHDDIHHYTRWKTARPLIEREAVFKQTGNEDERRQMFDEYVGELKRRHIQDEIDNRKTALQELESILKVIITDPDTTWTKAEQAIEENDRFTSLAVFRSLNKVDLLHAFDAHVRELDRARNEQKQKDKRLTTRRARVARDAFQQLLGGLHAQGRIKAGTKWQDFYPLIAEDERYLNMLTVPGSSPLDMFWDAVEDEDRKLRSKRNDALDVLEDRRFEMTEQTSLEEFGAIMSADPRTARFTDEELQMIYSRLMEKILRRLEEEKLNAERQQRKTVDALRSRIKHLDPPVRLGETYEEVAPRLEPFEEFQMLQDDDARRAAFEKHMRRIREKEQEDLERERVRRDRDQRNGSRRTERDDRERRHRTRTPEVDAYEADRKRAQANREKQYRKASFGLTPPPRERRDDRYDDRRRPDNMYERERREREMERERSYISRADPRDKGRTLDYGDEDAVVSQPGSIRKRRESDGSMRDNKRARRTRTPEPEQGVLKEEEPALQSGSEEGELAEL